MTIEKSTIRNQGGDILIALNHFCGSSLHFLQFFHILFQVWTPHLEAVFQLWPYTNVLYNLSIVSLSLVTIVLLIIPKVELAFFDASAHCLDGFALLCMITPKSLSSSLTFNTLPPITYGN